MTHESSPDTPTDSQLWAMVHAERLALAEDLAGLSDDGPFSSGAQDGALVSGGTLALIMAMAGRSAYSAELAGDRAATLVQAG
jgi:hypothetical protein